MLHFVEKETVKRMSKGGYIIIYFGFYWWWSIFWVVVCGGRYILAGGECWVVVVDIFWLVVGGCG